MILEKKKKILKKASSMERKFAYYIISGREKFGEIVDIIDVGCSIGLKKICWSEDKGTRQELHFMLFLGFLLFKSGEK